MHQRLSLVVSSLLLSMSLGACSSSPAWSDVSGKPATFPTDPSVVQARISQACPAGQAMIGAAQSGAPICVATGAGLAAAAPLALDASGASPALSLQPCPIGQILKSNGVTWQCGAEAARAYLAGEGLQLNTAGDTFLVSFPGAGGLAGTSRSAAREDHDHVRPVAIPLSDFTTDGGATLGVSSVLHTKTLRLGPQAETWAVVAIPSRGGENYDAGSLALAYVGKGTFVVGTIGVGLGTSSVTPSSGTPIDVDSLGKLAAFNAVLGIPRASVTNYLVIRLQNTSQVAGDVVEVVHAQVVFLDLS